MSRDVLVVGAGMAGVTLAAARVAAGDRVTILDKGRRHGGRMATRRVDDIAYDTGAPSFAVHSSAMQAAVRGWTADGSVEEVAGAAGTGAPRHRGRPMMRSLPGSLAAASGAEVRLGATVVGLTVVDGRWEVTVEEGRDTPTRARRRADVLVLTCPAPQTLALLRTAPGLAAPGTIAALERVTYDPCLAVLVRPLGRTLEPPAAGGAVAARTLLADAAFSATHLDGDRAAAAAELAAREGARQGVTLEVVHVHGWRYAQVVQGIDAPALRDDTAGPPLVIAGDLCTGHDVVPAGTAIEGVERAFLSGRAAAALLER